MDADEREFIRWFDLMGLQRHIKVLGIFARLYYRDGKSGYLKDLPRVLAIRPGGGGALPGDGGVCRLHRRAHRAAVSRRAGARPRAMTSVTTPGTAIEQPRAAMILAAGRGERLRPLTDHMPKPLLRGARQAVDRASCRAAGAAGIERIVINLAWLGSMIRDYLGDGSRYGVTLDLQRRGAARTGDGGRHIPRIAVSDPGAFLVVNGDIFTDYPFAQAGAGADRDAHLVLVPNPPQHPSGDFGLEQGLALPSAAVQYTFAGIAVYRRPFFAGLRRWGVPLEAAAAALDGGATLLRGAVLRGFGRTWAPRSGCRL